jgi:hypothetical protein
VRSAPSSEAESNALARVLPLRRVVVDCWIGVAQDGDRRLVRLAGRLTAAQVPELLTACAESGPVALDLSDLVSADVAGIDAIRRVRDVGVSVVGAVGYIQLKLDSPALGPAGARPPKARPSR